MAPNKVTSRFPTYSHACNLHSSGETNKVHSSAQPQQSAYCRKTNARLQEGCFEREILRNLSFDTIVNNSFNMIKASIQRREKNTPYNWPLHRQFKQQFIVTRILQSNSPKILLFMVEVTSKHADIE